MQKQFHVLDIFGASRRVASAWESQGYRGWSFDVKLDRGHDIVSELGFKLLLRKATELLDSR